MSVNLDPRPGDPFAVTTHLLQKITELERENAALEAQMERDAGQFGLFFRCEKLERENAALREKVDDWENAVLHALDHRPDEQHCTCVAPLIGKVKQLQRENAALRAMSDKADTSTRKRPIYQT